MWQQRVGKKIKKEAKKEVNKKRKPGYTLLPIPLAVEVLLEAMYNELLKEIERR